MAEKRMFCKSIIDSDAFLDMPKTTQCLYFHLNMRADDEGFINNPKKICRMIGCNDDDLKLLISKSFVIAFESGIIVIKHWKIHNWIRKERIHETNYAKEKSQLYLKENGAYSLDPSSGKPLVRHLTDKCQHRLVETSIDKTSIDKTSIERESNSDSSCDESIHAHNTKQSKHKHGLYKHVLLTDKELQTLSDKFGDALEPMIQKLDDYLSINKKSYKSHFNVINHGWIRDWAKEHGILDHVDIKIAEYNKPIEVEEVEIDDDVQRMLSSLD